MKELFGNAVMLLVLTRQKTNNRAAGAAGNLINFRRLKDNNN